MKISDPSTRAKFKYTAVCAGLLMVLHLTSCGGKPVEKFESIEDNSLAESATSSTAGEKLSQRQVLRLILKYKDNHFSVIKTKILNANPSPIPLVADEAPLVVETISDTDKVLFRGGIHDPRLAHLDIEDPDKPGSWQNEEINLAESIFQIKIPLEDGLNRLSISENRSHKQLLLLDLTPYLEEK